MKKNTILTLNGGKKSNKYLKNNYRKLFKKIDKLVYLKAPSFNHILKWRLHQEQKLKLISKNKGTMSKSKIREFIMFYERITRQMMKDYLKNIRYNSVFRQ